MITNDTAFIIGGLCLLFGPVFVIKLVPPKWLGRVLLVLAGLFLLFLFFMSYKIVIVPR